MSFWGDSLQNKASPCPFQILVSGQKFCYNIVGLTDPRSRSVWLLCVQEQGAEGRWQKADLLMQFAEWLYGQNQPLQTTQHHLHWAVDLLVQLDPELAQETGTPCTNLYHTVPLCSTVKGKYIHFDTLCYLLKGSFYCTYPSLLFYRGPVPHPPSNSFVRKECWHGPNTCFTYFN